MVFLVACAQYSMQDGDADGGAPEEETAGGDGNADSDEGQNDQTARPADDTDDVPEGENSPDVECYDNSDCGETIYGEKHCFQNGVVTPITKHVCVNPGSVDSYCKKEESDEVEMCSPGKEVCRGGECLVLAEQPCNETDDGRDYEEAGEVFDAELIKYNDRCLDEETLIEYYCSGGDKGVAEKEEHICEGECSGGECVESE
ncbi:MAG: hypothetical protein R6U32_02865 [Candidatus Woesearchaeota archaeon]